MQMPQKLDYIKPNLVKRVVRKLRRLAAQNRHKKPLHIPQDFRAISFCFDDFPVGALTGAQVLESADARGTFYTCFGLPGIATMSGPLALADDIRSIAARGHEIGCHTFDHIDCSYVSAQKVAESCRANRTAAQKLGLALASFSYPEGEMTPAVKKIIAQNYTSARSVLKGVNRGWCDAMCLKATPLYETASGPIWDALRDVEQKGGWLILVTHDVSKTPSQYGTKEQFFREIVDFCRAKNLPIRTVGNVVASLSTP
jgi:peptidoglycan/xylan/chitin deacetylase (PgdA/CDA1 family)